MKRMGWMVALSLMMFAACTPPGAVESPELAAKAEEWMALFNAGDMDGLMDLYTEDARLLPPNAEMVQGHEAIRADFAAMKEAGLSGSLVTVEAMTAADVGYRLGTYTLTAPDGSEADRGKYIETWRLIDGEWKIVNDIYNSDLEPSPQGRLMIATHEVGDPDVWLAAWRGDDRRRLFAEHGVAGARVFQSPDNNALTGLVLDVVDAEAFQGFLQSEDGAAAAAADTVDLSNVVILQQVD